MRSHHFINESKHLSHNRIMWQIRDDLGPYIKEYKAGRIDADWLGHHCVKMAHALAQVTGEPSSAIQQMINNYVDHELKHHINEGEFRSNSIEEFKPNKEKLDDLKSKFLPDWEMLDHRTLQAKYLAKDHRYAEKFIEWINELSEKMDHFAEVTQDVTEVTVKTSTFDVKGLTILDFQLAMKIDAFARKHDIEQVRMSGNFGMYENISEGLKNPKDNPCWKGYKPVGTKKKNGRTVPNCVPKESVETTIEAMEAELEALAEEGKASYKLCTSSKPNSELGASNLASCKSQGLRAREGKKSHKLGKSKKSRVTVGGHRIKGRKYGGPLPDWS